MLELLLSMHELLHLARKLLLPMHQLLHLARKLLHLPPCRRRPPYGHRSTDAAAAGLQDPSGEEETLRQAKPRSNGLHAHPLPQSMLALCDWPLHNQAIRCAQSVDGRRKKIVECCSVRRRAMRHLALRVCKRD